MDIIQRYTELTGFSINSSNQARIIGAISRTRSILEDMLGFTLDIDERKLNQTDEVIAGLIPVFAYRIYPLRQKDKYNHIDPCSKIYDIKILRNGVIDQTLTTDEYNVVYRARLIKYFTVNKILNLPIYFNTYFFQQYIAQINTQYDNYAFAVDAEYFFDPEKFPDDLMAVWVDMITYYSRANKDIKSETLGSHSYTKFDEKEPEQKDQNMNIIKRYAGPLGSVNTNNTF